MSRSPVKGARLSDQIAGQEIEVGETCDHDDSKERNRLGDRHLFPTRELQRNRGEGVTYGRRHSKSNDLIVAVEDASG